MRPESRTPPALAWAAVALLLWAAWWCVSRPSVYRTWPGRECRAVEPAGDCGDIPRHHRLIWVHESWEER